jgi:hypothetical protein
MLYGERMRIYSPGASLNDDYAYGCDNCEKLDGRPVLIWCHEDLPGENRDHFSICFDCLSELYFKYAASLDKIGESIIVKRTTIPEALRNEVFERDNNRCVQCGSSEVLTLDHIIPFSKGGKTEKANLQTLCRKCNIEKRDKLAI